MVHSIRVQDRFDLRYRSIKSEEYRRFDIPAEMNWMLLNGGTYHSKRYNKKITIIGLNDDYLNPMYSDGASGAFDIISAGWWFHDKLCNDCRWDDGTPITNWQASMVLSDILYSEGRYIRSKRWFWATFLIGGKKIKQLNGWF